jgi:release factor glutamine methyltransferase
MSDPIVAKLRSAGCVRAEEEAAVLRAAFAPEDLEAALARRCGGEPLEHVVGWADFAGVRVRVRSPVFVPRPGAEPLVDLTLLELRERDSAVVVDVGCGSGALGLAVRAAARSDITLLATDVDPAAVASAGDNGLPVHRGHWLDALPARWLGRVDVAVAHLPYVPTGALGEVARDYRDAEALVALDGGLDGLDPLRQVLPQLDRWLAPSGVLLTLASHRQSAGVQAVVAAAGRTGKPCIGVGGSTFWRIS